MQLDKNVPVGNSDQRSQLSEVLSQLQDIKTLTDELLRRIQDKADTVFGPIPPTPLSTTQELEDKSSVLYQIKMSLCYLDDSIRAANDEFSRFNEL